MVIVTGIQAAGKTTVGHLLAARLHRSAFIDSDCLARMVVGGRAGMTPEASAEAVSQLHLRYAQAALLADSFHRSGFTAVMADNIYGPDLVDQVGRVCAQPLIVVVLAPSDEAVVAREKGRGTAAYRDWMTGAPLERAVAEFQGYLAATPRIGLWLGKSNRRYGHTALLCQPQTFCSISLGLDTTEQTPEETVDAILARAWTEGTVEL